MLALPASLMRIWRSDKSFRFHTSPLGVVPKKNEVTATDGRVIVDLSWPRANSLNDYTVRSSIPTTVWAPAAEVGRRIHQLSTDQSTQQAQPGERQFSTDQSTQQAQPGERQIFALVGDVNAAFRNIPNHASNVKWFGLFVPELDVIVFDMSAPFGWTASPMFYGVFGNGISSLVKRESPHTLNPHLSSDSETFFCYEWVDDYILVERDTPGRLHAAETALRLAMTLTLGPTAIHQKKFAERWEQSVHYLGLDWCLQSYSVSMPRAKIEKALARVEDLLASSTVTRLQLQRLVGSLRHVSTCIPAARPFYQRLQAASCIPRGSKHAVSEGLKADCQWFTSILKYGHLQSIPVSIFADISDPNLHLYMDACDSGLVVLNIPRKEYILIEFDHIEREAILRIKARSALPKRHGSKPGHPKSAITTSPESHQSTDFSINVREFFSVALALCIWGSSWSCRNEFFHVHAWIDNSAAVTWCNKLASPNRLAQQLLRVMSLTLARFRIHLSASHMPGNWNRMADAGSRSMACTKAAETWSSFSDSWSRAQVPNHLRHCYQCTSPTSSLQHWPQPLAAATQHAGTNGPSGATKTTTQPSYHGPQDSSQASSSSSPNICFTTPPLPTMADLSCPRSAQSIGVIGPSSATPLASHLATASPLMAWLGPEPRLPDPNQSTRPSSGPSFVLPPVPPSETTRFGVAWSSPSSSASAPASTPALQPEPTTTSAAKMCRSPTTKAVQPETSRRHERSTCSSGAVKVTAKNGVAPGTSTGRAIPRAAQSSLRGACERLASTWASVP